MAADDLLRDKGNDACKEEEIILSHPVKLAKPVQDYKMFLLEEMSEFVEDE